MPEQPGNARGARQVGRKIRKLCKGTDKALAELERKYALDPAVTQRLSDFEAEIEAAVPDRRGR